MSNNTTASDTIILGKDYTQFKRFLAFFSILIIYFFYCYNFMVGTFVKPTMILGASEGGFGFTLKQTEEIFAIMSIATIPGTLIFGTLASKIGKKYTLILIAILIAATTFLPMLNTSSFDLWRISRFTTGLTLGGVFGTAVPLVSEMFPQKYRGKLAAIMTSMFSIAMIFGGQIYGFFGDSNWSVLMYTAIIPPIIGAVLCFFLVPNDYEYTKEINKDAKAKGKKINYFNMYKGKYLLIGIGVICLSGANFTAYSAFSNNATTYLTSELKVSALVAGSIFSIQGFGQLFGYIFWGTIADKFGRKKPAIGMILSGIIVFIFAKNSPDNITMFYVIAVFLGFSIGFSGAWGAYYTELFPKEFSSLAPGISFNGGRIISSYALPIIAGLATTSSGMMPIFLVSSVVFIIGAIIWGFLPETLNKGEK